MEKKKNKEEEGEGPECVKRQRGTQKRKSLKGIIFTTERKT